MKAKVCPPRLGGARVGVFSTRSPHRPNNIGLSLARLDSVQGDTVRRLSTTLSTTLSTAVPTAGAPGGGGHGDGHPRAGHQALHPTVRQPAAPTHQRSGKTVVNTGAVLNPFALIAHIVWSCANYRHFLVIYSKGFWEIKDIPIRELFLTL